MVLIVDDTNILIDLVNTGLIAHCRQLDISFHTTDFVVGELRDSSQRQQIQQYIDEGGLTVDTLKNKDLTDVLLSYQDYATFSNLSVADVSVLWLAEKLECRLLTSDQKLLHQAHCRGLEANGLLWLTDLLVERHIVPPSEMMNYLLKLLETNERAPHKLVTERIDKYIMNMSKES